MKVFSVIFLSMVLLGSVSWACDKHPGMTHEQWVSAVRDERDSKTGAVKTTSDNFFTTVGKDRDLSSDRERGPSERKYREDERRVREVR